MQLATPFLNQMAKKEDEGCMMLGKSLGTFPLGLFQQRKINNILLSLYHEG